MRERRTVKLIAGLLTVVASLPAWAQPGTAPAYIQALADFEVASLDGARAPTNGTSSLRSVTPSEWLTSDPAIVGLPGVIVAWNGGAKGIGSRLFVHGGGHNDSANNGLYIFDFAGGSRPTGWDAPLTISAVAAVRAGDPTYTDGNPGSVHTYDGMVYAKHNNRIYRFNGGSYGPIGAFTSASFKFDVASKTWTQLPNFPGGAGGAVTFYDPASGNIFVANAASASGYFFRTNNDTWSGPKNINGLAETAGAWDPTRNRGVVIGIGGSYVVNINFNTETVSTTPLIASGQTAILAFRALSTTYDPQRDVFWIFGGPETSPGWSTIYEMPAIGSPWTIVPHTLTGAPIQKSPGLVGSYGRFTMMDQWRAIGLVASPDSPAYVIKLPTGTVVVDVPKAPTSVAAN
jgi:hypothetical protein